MRLRPALWCVLSLALVNNVLAVSLRAKNEVTLEEQGKDPFSVNEDPFSVSEDPFSVNEDPFSVNEDPFSVNEDLTSSF